MHTGNGSFGSSLNKSLNFSFGIPFLFLCLIELVISGILYKKGHFKSFVITFFITNFASVLSGL